MRGAIPAWGALGVLESWQGVWNPGAENLGSGSLGAWEPGSQGSGSLRVSVAQGSAAPGSRGALRGCARRGPGIPWQGIPGPQVLPRSPGILDSWTRLVGVQDSRTLGLLESWQDPENVTGLDCCERCVDSGLRKDQEICSWTSPGAPQPRFRPPGHQDSKFQNKANLQASNFEKTGSSRHPTLKRRGPPTRRGLFTL